MTKVLRKPHFEKPHLVMGLSETGKSKSASISPYSFQKYIHNWPAPRHKPIIDTLMKFGIGADSSTFGLLRFATPHYQMGFAENYFYFMALKAESYQ